MKLPSAAAATAGIGAWVEIRVHQKFIALATPLLL
jgi:hypothetical protein